MHHMVVIPRELNKGEVKESSREKELSYIFENYYKRIYNYIYYRINCHHTSEDLTSKVFEKVILNINNYSEEKSPFEVWVFAIARNTLNDYFRSLKKQKIFSIDRIKDLVSRKKTPEEVMVVSDTNSELLKALQTLDKRDRNIIALKFGGCLKNKEIAEILNITESNVGVIVHRSMKKLKKEIEKRDRYG